MMEQYEQIELEIHENELVDVYAKIKAPESAIIPGPGQNIGRVKQKQALTYYRGLTS